MTRTLRFGMVELDSTRERAHGHDFEDRQTLVPPAHFAHGTPWPLHAVPAEVSDLASGPRSAPATGSEPSMADPSPFVDEYEIDYVPTVPVTREVIDPEEAEPLPPIDLNDDLGTRTLMGIGARAVRSVAKSGWVEARPARREPRATPDASASRSMRSSIDGATPARVIITPPAAGGAGAEAGSSGSTATGASSRRMLAKGSSRVPSGPAAQPLHLPPEELEPAGVPIAGAGPALEVRRRAPARAKRKRTSPGYRVIGVSLLALAVAALAAYIATAVFFAFSNSWVMPAVVSPSDDKVVALKTGLAAQQHQRDRLAAELEEAARTIAAQPDPRSDVAQQAVAHRRILEASIARQDEIIRGLEQSPYLRAIADRAHVALVPYDNLEHVAPGTKLVACRVAMVMCREVGRVIEVLPGEVTFKHPRREKMMRGQMIELQLSEREAAARDVLFLGGAPLLF